MPVKRTRRVRRTRRSTGRRRTFRKRKMAIQRPIGVRAPSTYTTTLVYYERASLTSTTGAFGTFAYNANSLYDPTTAVGGHQPMYYDQLTALYNKYIVNKSSFTYSFAPYSTTGGSTATAFCRVDDNASLGGGSVMYTQLETRGTKHVFCPIYEDNQVYTRKLTATYDRKRYFKNFENSNLVGENSDPSKLIYFLVGVQSDDLTTTTTFMGWVKITYNCTFYSLKDISSS